MNDTPLSLLGRRSLLVFLLISFFSISLMGLIWHRYSLKAQHASIESAIIDQVHLIGVAIRPALSFQDRDYALKILTDVSATTPFNSVLVFDHRHALLAQAGNFDPLLLEDVPLKGLQSVIHQDGSLLVIEPVLLGGELLGHVVTVTGEQTLLHNLKDPYPVILGGMAIAFLMALLLALVLNRRYEKTARRNEALLATLHSQNDALQQAKEEAETANRAKDIFLANISHELRTPLNGILGMNQLMRQSGLTETQQEFSGSIDSSARHLLAIVEQLLGLSIIETEAPEERKEPFSLSQLVSELVRTKSLEAAQKGLALSFYIDRSVPAMVNSHSTFLRQVLSNIIDNAVKYTQKGFVHVDAHREGEELHLQVRDSGPGIAAVEQQQIFENFYRGSHDGTEAVSGAGLGLAISNKLIQRLGGIIRLESQSGMGCTFHIRVPYKPTEAASPTLPLWISRICVVSEDEWLAAQIQAYCETMAQQQSVRISTTLPTETAAGELLILDTRCAAEQRELLQARNVPRLWLLPQGKEKECDETCLVFPCSLQKFADTITDIIPPEKVEEHPDIASEQGELIAAHGRVLIVEDNAINRKIAHAALRHLGATISEATDGREALKLVRSHPFDCVLMDIRMPVMDGITATRLIREEFDAEQLPIIGITAQAVQAEIEKALAAGMNRVVTKPIDIHALARDVEEILTQQPQGDTFSINLQLLQRDLGDDPELFRDLLTRISARMREALEKLDLLLTQADINAAMPVLDTLSDTLATIHAYRPLQQLRQLVESTRSHDANAMQKRWAPMRRLIEQIAQQVEAEASSDSP